MNRLLEGKTAIITGARRGIGREIAVAYAKHGADIIVCARQQDEEFENDIENLAFENSIDSHIEYFDLTDSEQMKRAVKSIRSHAKNGIDILVNNAGILSDYKRFNMMPIEDSRKLFDVDFWGQMEFTQYISRLMQRQGKGSILYISSIAGIDAFFSSYDYVACKAAINGAVKQQARELGEFGIRVNAIAPGLIETDMIKDNDKDNLESIKPAIILGRFGTKKEIADVAVFLASDMASYITSQIIRVDGGTTPPKANW